MKCQFCNQELVYSHHENNKEVSIYDCRNCPMLIMFHYLLNETAPVKIAFFLQKNGRTYVWVNNFINNFSYVTEIVVAPSVITSNPILQLPKLVDVTPENVYQKFSFYMVFA